jgi:hypothetical protein
MLASDRVVFGRSFRVTPLWVWWAQRLSGLSLGHIFAPAWGHSVWLMALLLAVVAIHGYCGLRRIAPAARTAMGSAAAAWIWTLAVVVPGLLILAAY